MRRFLLSVASFLLAASALSAQEDLACPAFREGEIIIRHPGFILSYNPAAMLPDWVAYELAASDMEGNAERARFFSPDPSPELEGCTLAQHWHYTNSGWVRGHMVPAGDLKYCQEAMSSSFYTTNVCPMEMTFNNGIWKRLEEKVRRIALRFGRVYIATGPVIGANRHGEVGQSGILVPDAFFKAILVPDGDAWLGIGFYMTNEPAPRGSRLRDYAVTVDELEDLTGLNFFPALDSPAARQAERQLPFRELEL